MNDRLLKESDVMRIAFQLPYVVNSSFFDAVKALPSADRPQGEWLDTGKDPSHSHPLTAIWYRCSECGDGTNTKTNYCPSCGAHMKGADDETDKSQSE